MSLHKTRKLRLRTVLDPNAGSTQWYRTESDSHLRETAFCISPAWINYQPCLRRFPVQM